ncbi:oxidoreductase [Colletotrichum karsti]|uniref:Oxidoreductase n=1 Tax=Colletotrichum karsti TaxID=1095194 RepID=A0A9P6IA88_9PEZI|nr:oxidoreductase [Colletotrichum karsti]KAF9879183.1 oxidoreductase [Colletotrichum karsti]
MRVLISGAGVAGPTLAWFLARTGARVTILEKSSSLLRQGHNIDVNYGAIKVIRKMGLIDELKRWNTTEKGTKLIDSQGKPFAPFPVKSGSASPTSEFEILRGDLAWFLYEATKNHPNVEYLFGVTSKEVLSNDEKSVKVELSNGEVNEYDVLVAADGQWSRIRKQCFPQDSVTVVDKDMYVVYSTIPRLPQDDDWWNVFVGLGSRIVTLRPDPHGTIRAMFTRMPLNDAQRRLWQEATRSDRKTQQELVRREFADAGWQALRMLDAMEQSEDYYFQAIQQIKMKKWSTGRVVCLGDAAWTPSPLTGMGCSLAISGAYVLAGELGNLAQGEHPGKAFDEFENKLREYVEETQNIPWFFPAFMHPDPAWKRWVLQSFLAGMSRLVTFPWFAKKFSDDTSVEDSDFKLPEYSKFEVGEVAK